METAIYLLFMVAMAAIIAKGCEWIVAVALAGILICLARVWSQRGK